MMVRLRRLPDDRLSSVVDAEERELLEKLLDLLRSESNPADVKGSIKGNVRSFWEFLPRGEKTVLPREKKKAGVVIKVDF
jgi:hypothetical protein